MGIDETQRRNTAADALIEQLERGRLLRFADYATLTQVIPGSGAGVYSIWDDGGGLVYTGIAQRNPAGKDLARYLAERHASLPLRVRERELSELAAPLAAAS